MRNRLLIGVFIIVFLAVGVILFLRADKQPVLDIEEVSFEEVQGTEDVEDDDEIEGIKDVEIVPEIIDEPIDQINNQEEQSSIASEINLAVPFTPQAPHANWDLPYQEACEEASAYMVWLYYSGHESGLVNADIADAALLEMMEFEDQLLGTYLDTTAQETANLILKFYRLNTYVVHNPTVEQIKAQIAKGLPVIVPAAGRELGNPNFSGDGPLYHMLVLRGYTQDQWITNDPGTRNGQGYVYDIDVIMNAMGDWNHGDPANGDKTVIFVEPQ